MDGHSLRLKLASSVGTVQTGRDRKYVFITRLGLWSVDNIVGFAAYFNPTHLSKREQKILKEYHIYAYPYFFFFVLAKYILR